MTGLEFIETSKAELRESQSTTASLQTMLYPKHVIWAANRIAEDTWALNRDAVVDIVNGQIEYPVPQRPYRLGSVNVNDGNGNIYPLAGITGEQADEQFFNWRAGGQPQWQGIPQFYIDDGESFKLLPVPNYGVQDGLILTGYFSIGDWWDLAEQSPLMANCDEAIQMGTCYRRCREMLGVEDVYGDKLHMYKKDFEDAKRALYRQSIGKNDARRNSIPSRGKRMGAWGFGWSFVGGI